MLTTVIVAPFHFCLTLGIRILTLKKRMFTSWDWITVLTSWDWIIVLSIFSHISISASTESSGTASLTL